ncbi:Myc-type, basic helix-loop-helix domain-containing protein, partial [Piptocephalis cylindrospora]
TSSTPSEDGEDPNREDKRPLLTEEEKRSNHIKSEQKRRNAIRQGFIDLCACVPPLNNVKMSKSVMLEEAIDWIRRLSEECEELDSELDR